MTTCPRKRKEVYRLYDDIQTFHAVEKQEQHALKDSKKQAMNRLEELSIAFVISASRDVPYGLNPCGKLRAISPNSSIKCEKV